MTAFFCRRSTLALLFGLLALVLAAAGCAAKRLPPPQAATDCWSGFQNRYAVPTPAGGIAASCSLSWRQGKKTARVLLDLWGNFDQENGGRSAAFRMDAWSNVGGNLSYIMEDEQGIAALYPDPLRVYTHNDSVTGARMLGLPFPFSLAHLAALLAGDFGALVPVQFQGATPGTDNGWVFTFHGETVSALGLDSLSRPLFLEGPAYTWSSEGESVSAGTWHIDFSSYDQSSDGQPEQPGRMDIILPPDSSGILRIKSRELTVAPWPDNALQLIIPETAEIRTLDHTPRDWTTGEAPQQTTQPMEETQ